MAVAGAAFEGAEGMLGERGAAAHMRTGILHPRPMPFEDGFMLPTIDGARRRLGGETAGAQRTDAAIGLATHIPDLDPPAGVCFGAVRGPEKRASRTAIDIRFGVVDERFVAHAALRFKPRGSPGLRNVSDDPVILAGFQRTAIVIAGIGERRQRFGSERLPRGFSHLVKRSEE